VKGDDVGNNPTLEGDIEEWMADMLVESVK
jgi:hypothetical protein